MHNVLVPAGEIFSYNDALGNAGSLADGWKMALTIFEGVNLRPAPGGGVCQVSTTIFRAALRAGLPIVEQKNHSLYVSYYEAYGVGQDATVYPGKQDFRFKNDTGHPILLQSYNEGDDAYVNIYGIDDGRAVTVKGPYFAATTPEEVKNQDKKLRANEIGWVRSVQSADGTATDDVFVARYNAIPKSLPKKYSATVEQTKVGVGMANMLHAAAGSGVVMR
jgi:vancomycin resistance protein YoaR